MATGAGGMGTRAGVFCVSGGGCPVNAANVFSASWRKAWWESASTRWKCMCASAVWRCISWTAASHWAVGSDSVMGAAGSRRLGAGGAGAGGVGGVGFGSEGRVCAVGGV